MRNMLQLLGGVAVAGAVAAGTTAFTASGLTNTASLTSTGISGGGSVSVNVNAIDAKLTAVSMVNDPTSPDLFTGVTITVRNSADNANYVDANVGKISAKFTGSGGSGGTAAWGACTIGTGTDDGNFSCAIPGGTYDTITAVKIAITA
ncbi:hypothetical protein HH310_04870 [Actinoplanes sp. TBRC 11911]|uniref:hypothetical protein n=1 Tax=Actinoplanes sp. TBRC 11911 TaxID=2729386 RepID=UPI00145E1F5F|nr:hypothetical protein [Actinoplanes sp. TBRC 11911]NMO50525.1 hypothetical protein [Actinoplanes sp. TBRC 11911]